MKINPYVVFNGNCAEALQFYERAFNAKVTMISRYKDSPPEDGYVAPPEEADLIMHAQLDLGGEVLMFCDVTADVPYTVGSNIAISVAFDTESAAKVAFSALKDGGVVSVELQETFWSKCFGSLTDKFGIIWQITILGQEHVVHK